MYREWNERTGCECGCGRLRAYACVLHLKIERSGTVEREEERRRERSEAHSTASSMSLSICSSEVKIQLFRPTYNIMFASKMLVTSWSRWHTQRDQRSRPKTYSYASRMSLCTLHGGMVGAINSQDPHRPLICEESGLSMSDQQGRDVGAHDQSGMVTLVKALQDEAVSGVPGGCESEPLYLHSQTSICTSEFGGKSRRVGVQAGG